MDPVTIAAVGWSVTMVGWVASATISRLLNKCFDYIDHDTKKKLAQLEPKILVLERVMEVVETSPDRPRLEKLFKELKSAYYEAEEILDAVEYHCLERKINGRTSPKKDRMKKKLWPAMAKFSSQKNKSDGGAPPPKKDHMKKKLWSAMAKFFPLKNKESGMSEKKLIESLKKIEDVINEAYQILDKLLSISNDNRRKTVVANPPTTAVSPHKVFGRDKDRDKILAMLHEKEGHIHPSTSNSLCFSVIGIHGVGGSGKSTLAQFVCAHEEKDKQDNKDGHFDLIMWVHVSQNFKVVNIFKELYEAASEPKEPCPQFSNPGALEKELERKLDGKRFLLVLDDVWCNKDVGDQELPKLLSPLKKGKKGSKILVTTRNKYALTDLGPGVRYNAMPIPEFDDAAFFELFMYYALEDDQDQSMFQKIGAEIAKMLMRSPLAAKIVGGNLRRQQEVNYWRGVRDDDLFNKRTGPLWWSYYQLGEQARRCFAYCSIFPRGLRLYRADLISLWMAEGFIRSTDERGDMEDVGQEIFNELLSISFLQVGGRDKSAIDRTHLSDRNYRDYDKDYYLVPYLLHDLARAVSGSDCFRINNTMSQGGEGWTGDVPGEVRHLFVQNYDAALITGKILELGNLHSLIIYNVEQDTPVDEIVIESILKRLPKLRVLAMAFGPQELIHKPDIFSVPESIGQLKHLRYLAFRMDYRCKVVIPSTLNHLYQMQLLDFGKCENLVFSCGDLNNLRHVFSRSASISNIDRLVSLQTFPQFTVRDEQGHEANQLRYLDRLCGKLNIYGLENVKSREEALEVNLVAKERLIDLTLTWGGGDTRCTAEVEAEVLEGLCPPVGLEVLSIWCYKGSIYPNWMVGRQNGGPEKLQELRLMCWSQPGPAPELDAFIHLGSLTLRECSWNALPGNMEHLSSLKRLIIFRCLNVRSLPTLPQSLEHFVLWFCNDGFMKSCETYGHPNWRKIKHIRNKDIMFPARSDEGLESE